jgi:hypothetical protein
LIAISGRSAGGLVGGMDDAIRRVLYDMSISSSFGKKSFLTLAPALVGISSLQDSCVAGAQIADVICEMCTSGGRLYYTLNTCTIEYTIKCVG